VTSVAFVIPGDLRLPTGGYAYDRRVLALLAGNGIAAEHVPLPAGFPDPTADELAETSRILEAVPETTTLLIDGLAYGALPAELIGRLKHRIVALVHHPLCLEAGLAPMRARYLQQTEQMALAFATAVIVTSPMTARILAEGFAVDPARITVAEPGTDRAARARGTGDPVQLLAVGSVVPRKAYDLLMHALGPHKSDRWQLTIAGAVRDQTAWDAFAAARDQYGLIDNVNAVGPVSDGALGALYDTADLFLMPSLFEGYGMVLAEAMARGLPIVCTTGGAAAETVPNAAAIKVRPGDASAFGAAVGHLIADAGARAVLAEASWAAGQALPTWDDTARIVASALKGERA
jgi:glycosyltransferase involved in cell wall biosynthesis